MSDVQIFLLGMSAGAILTVLYAWLRMAWRYRK